jgi:nucleoside-diphosphate-sugar epimerase
MSRIFLAGASGVIGRRLTPLLLDHGHSVWAATRSPDNGEFLRKLGAPGARIRDEGTRNLVAAARKAGARRLIAQSIAWAYAPGPRPFREDHPLDLTAEGDRLVSVRGVASLEGQVLAASPMEGAVLRYGRLYGPGGGANTPPSPPAVHVDAAAYAALLAIDHGEAGAFNIADPNDEVSTDKATSALGWRADSQVDLAQAKLFHKLY